LKAFITNPIFRWIAVLPGAFLATVAAQFPWHWAVVIFGWFAGWFYIDEDLNLLDILFKILGPEEIEIMGYGFLLSFVSISVAARIAPRFKKETALVMSVIVVGLLVSFWTVGRSWLNQQFLEIDVIPTLVANGLSVLGIWVAWRYVRPWWER
jgi:hypothetical protein